jgi:hypothetical protein
LTIIASGAATAAWKHRQQAESEHERAPRGIWQYVGVLALDEGLRQVSSFALSWCASRTLPKLAVAVMTERYRDVFIAASFTLTRECLINDRTGHGACMRRSAAR